MTDLDTLTEAFAELERRADVAMSRSVADPSTYRPTPRRFRLTLVAAAVVAVLAVALGVALFTGDRGHDGSGAAATPSTARTVAPPDRTTRPPTTPTTAVTRSVTPSRTPSATTPPPPKPVVGIPMSAKELAQRFRGVLGNTATFTIRLSQDNRSARDPYIVGILTAAGQRGGFDLQMLPATPGQRASCDDPDKSACTVRRLPNGSSLALSHVALEGAPNRVTYMANLIRRDGVEILMHVSNEADPKGDSAVLSPTPPLSLTQLSRIITSERWSG
jgi:hypothetical protein